MRWFDELLYSDRSSLGYIQRFKVDKVLKEVKTKRQHLLIFETPYFGRVLVIDGVVQTTEKDEFAYHEMLSHVPILAHGKVKSVLIVGWWGWRCIETSATSSRSNECYSR
tara:strand:- start:98 stop:427 length:330 start_codon:yes stop_codon:yes gene_type:complete